MPPFKKGFIPPKSPIRRGNPIASTKATPFESLVLKGLSHEEKTFRSDLRLYGSDAAFCPRKSVFHHQVDPDETCLIGPASTLYMGAGVEMHNKITDALFKEGALLYKEFRLPDMGVKLGAYIDAIVLVNGELRCIEIKTCGALPSKPKLTYQYQAQLYAAVTGLPISLFFISRNIASWGGGSPEVQIRELPITMGDEEIKYTLRLIATSAVYAQAKIAPPRPSHIRTESDCGYCSFKKKCWGDDAEPDALVEPELAGDMEEAIEEWSHEWWATRMDRHEAVLDKVAKEGTVVAANLLETRGRGAYSIFKE